MPSDLVKSTALYSMKNDDINISEVHLWSLDIESVSTSVSFLNLFFDIHSKLSSDELARANLFLRDVDRVRWMTVRSALRYILAEVTCQQPEDIIFVYNAFGAPRHSTNKPYFNVSHSENRALIAISDVAKIGIDTENPERKKILPQIMASFLSKEEKHFFHSNQGELEYRLLQHWVRKEALVKAMGVGFSRDIRTLTIQPKLSGRIITEVDGITYHIQDIKDQYDWPVALASNRLHQRILHYSSHDYFSCF